MYYRRLKSKQRTSFIERNWAVSIWHSKRSLYYYLSTDTQPLHSFQSNFRSRYQIYSALTMSTFARTCDAIRLFDRGVVCWRSLGVNRATPRRDKIAAVLTLGCSALVSRVFVPAWSCDIRRHEKRRIKGPAVAAAVRLLVMSPKSFAYWVHPFYDGTAISWTILGRIHFSVRWH